MNIETARFNMIEQQIRPWNVLQMQTLNALAEVRREDFVPEEYKNLAFVDCQIAIGHGEVMLEPKVGARMVEALSLNADSVVFQVGCGSGYITALLARLCAKVTCIEIVPEFCELAAQNLKRAGIDNVELIEGDCFDHPVRRVNGVLVTGSVPDLGCFAKRLKRGGRLVGFQGGRSDDLMVQAMLLEAGAPPRSLFETSAPRLQNVEDEDAFVF